MSFSLSRVDHFVLTVKDLEASADFYERVLHMDRVAFDDGRIALRFGDSKINLHQCDHVYKPNADQATPGSADVCLITETSLDEVVASLRRTGVSIELGIVRRTGALGSMESIYIRDPDRNLIELSRYPHADE